MKVRVGRIMFSFRTAFRSRVVLLSTLFLTAFLCALPRVLKPGGVLHLSTDHKPYFDAWTGMLAKIPFLVPDMEVIADVRDLKTDFELQWEAQGKTVGHLAYRMR